MATFTRKSLAPAGTEGTGEGITVVGTTYTALHRGPTDTSTWEEVHLWATNIGSVTYVIELQFGYAAGGSVVDEHKIHSTIQPGETIYISPGLTIKGHGTARDVGAVLNVNTDNVVNIFGYANVINQN